MAKVEPLALPALHRHHLSSGVYAMSLAHWKSLPSVRNPSGTCVAFDGPCCPFVGSLAIIAGELLTKPPWGPSSCRLASHAASHRENPSFSSRSG